MSELSQQSQICRICGVELARQEDEIARLMAWPPMLLPGDLPDDDELCRRCLAATHA